jgi:hypothetical protein
VKSVTLVQLGDVHLPDCRDDLVGDIKDSGAPRALVDSIAPQKLMLVIRSVLDVCDRRAVAGVLICGDLTSRGSIAEYEECVQYLNRALDLANVARWSPEVLHVVPGNHDVDRAMCDPDGKDLLIKFDQLKQTWADIGLPILAVESVRASRVAAGESGVELFSVNSCMGCGEKRLLPEAVADQIKDILDRYAASAAPADAFDLVGEQLDTPAFDHNHVEDLMKGIAELDDSWVPIVLAHHNVLPQAIPRIALYTEVVNGGLVRSRLASCNRPVIYCHGHIHDDPVEIIQDQRKTNGKVIAVSAPELIKGFNVITLYFSRRHLPLGCEISCFRLQNDGAVTEAQRLRVPLATSTSLSKYRDDTIHAVLQATTDKPLRFEELRERVNEGRATALQRPSIKEALSEAEWLELIEITNRTESFEHWQIRRREP